MKKEDLIMEELVKRRNAIREECRRLRKELDGVIADDIPLQRLIEAMFSWGLYEGTIATKKENTEAVA